MLKIETIKLDLLIPSEALGFVFMHPFLSLSDVEPFVWLSPNKTVQISRIKRCLELANQEANRSGRATFTIFPEYALPGLDGVATIQRSLESDDWRTDTVIIGGVDGLTKSEYSELCSQQNTYVSEENRPDKVGEAYWVNCLVLWTVVRDKDGNRSVNRWIQPKLSPSSPEELAPDKYMFEGKTVFLFECNQRDGRVFRFLCLICYDWIAPSQTGLKGVLATLNETWKGPDPKQLHLIIVIQHNKKPNHPSYLVTALNYFVDVDDIYPFVGRKESFIAFINTAGEPCPGPVRSYGFSSLIYPPNANLTTDECPLSFAVDTKLLRHSDDLQRCGDILFRENGACSHSLKALQPRHIVPLAANARRLPVAEVTVYGIDEETDDPRASGAPVAAITKWINDRLDLSLPLESSSEDIKDKLKLNHDTIICQIRKIDPSILKSIIKYSNNLPRTGTNDDTWLKTIDNWPNEYDEPLFNMLRALSLIMLSYEVKLGGQITSVYARNGDEIIDIIVITGPSHKENLAREEALYSGYQGRKVLVISQDRDDGPLTDRDKKVYDVSDVTRCGYHDLKHCLAASDSNELKSKIKTVIGMK